MRGKILKLLIVVLVGISVLVLGFFAGVDYSRKFHIYGNSMRVVRCDNYIYILRDNIPVVKVLIASVQTKITCYSDGAMLAHFDLDNDTYAPTGILLLPQRGDEFWGVVYDSSGKVIREDKIDKRDVIGEKAMELIYRKIGSEPAHRP